MNHLAYKELVLLTIHAIVLKDILERDVEIQVSITRAKCICNFVNSEMRIKFP